MIHVDEIVFMTLPETGLNTITEFFCEGCDDHGTPDLEKGIHFFVGYDGFMYYWSCSKCGTNNENGMEIQYIISYRRSEWHNPRHPDSSEGDHISSECQEMIEMNP